MLQSSLFGSDKLVLDIETKNTFAQVGGQANIHLLDTSFVGVYSYAKDKYLSFFENEIQDLTEYLQRASLVVGFSINRFDIPVLKKHFNFDLFKIPRLDLLEEIEMSMGRRISLDILAKTNLGLEKTHHSLEAITLYQAGNLKELESYCLNDVKITKDLYELAKKQGHLLVPDRQTGEIKKITLPTGNWM